MVGIIQKRIAVVRHVQTVAKQFAERKLASQVNPVLHLIFQPHTERNVRTGKSLPAARRNRHTQSHKNIGSETPCVRIRKFITVRKEVELHLSAQFDQAPAERTLRHDPEKHSVALPSCLRPVPTSDWSLPPT